LVAVALHSNGTVIGIMRLKSAFDDWSHKTVVLAIVLTI